MTPRRPLRPCTQPGCPELVTSGRCAAHTRRRPPDNRPSASRRGYDRHWRRVRAAFLADNPACEACGQLATEVDHRDGNARHNAAANLRAFCKSCHSRRTARDQAFGRGKPKDDRDGPQPRRWAYA